MVIKNYIAIGGIEDTGKTELLDSIRKACGSKYLYTTKLVSNPDIDRFIISRKCVINWIVYKNEFYDPNNEFPYPEKLIVLIDHILEEDSPKMRIQEEYLEICKKWEDLGIKVMYIPKDVPAKIRRVIDFIDDTYQG